jgi:NAD(P)-dependent dehydrogenase (short-subunit alcohol dehydrogenase family)
VSANEHGGWRLVLAGSVVGAPLESNATGDEAINAPPRTILVTGAGGIGLAVCDRLANAGASLLLAARDVNKLQLLCTQLPDNGRAAGTWKGDQSPSAKRSKRVLSRLRSESKSPIDNR